ncbi:MAG: AAA family ATPase [Candidatus Buchananbacteria bacterium]
MAKIILGFVGPIASGKGTVCQYLKEKHNAQIFRFSSMLRDVLDRFYIEQSRENMQTVSSALRQAFGDDLMAKTIANDVTNTKVEIVAVDGVRREPDIKYLREISGFYLINIDADQKTRWQRITTRGENIDDTQKTLEQFQKDEQREAEKNIQEVAKLADFKLDNNGTLDQLKKQIDDILAKIKKS